jgi:hypothetical protein
MEGLLTLFIILCIEAFLIIQVKSSDSICSYMEVVDIGCIDFVILENYERYMGRECRTPFCRRL